MKPTFITWGRKKDLLPKRCFFNQSERIGNVYCLCRCKKKVLQHKKISEYNEEPENATLEPATGRRNPSVHGRYQHTCGPTAVCRYALVYCLLNGNAFCEYATQVPHWGRARLRRLGADFSQQNFEFSAGWLHVRFIAKVVTLKQVSLPVSSVSPCQQSSHHCSISSVTTVRGVR
jgi:hypothetical protein